MNQAIIDRLSSLTISEVLDLTEQLREKWGIRDSAPAPVCVPTIGIGYSPVPEEKTSFDVWLDSYGPTKLAVIKALRNVVPGIGIVEAKALVEKAPIAVAWDVDFERAALIVAALVDAGATASVK